MTLKRRLTISSWVRALSLGLFALVFLPACQKRCQSSETQSIKSIVDTQWRLVETTDPEVKATLNNYNFLILTFNRNNTGQVNRVVDNDQYETPVLQLVYAPNASQKTLRIQFSTVAGSVDDTQNQSLGTPGDAGTFDYQYALGGQLQMREIGSGSRSYYYRYVPFKGVVDPDTVCTF